MTPVDAVVGWLRCASVCDVEGLWARTDLDLRRLLALRAALVTIDEYRARGAPLSSTAAHQLTVCAHTGDARVIPLVRPHLRFALGEDLAGVAQAADDLARAPVHVEALDVDTDRLTFLLAHGGVVQFCVRSVDGRWLVAGFAEPATAEDAVRLRLGWRRAG